MAGAAVKLTPLVENVPGECPTCGFDSMRRARMYRLSEHGVTLVADRTVCGRCINEEG